MNTPLQSHEIDQQALKTCVIVFSFGYENPLNFEGEFHPMEKPMKYTL